MKAHFTKLIKAGNKLREFNFRKLASAANNLYHVDLSDDRGNRIIFKVQKDSGQWKLVDQALPQWIVEAETALHSAIEEEV
jgi:hypothetical protein